jgi:hypothetical protein
LIVKKFNLNCGCRALNYTQSQKENGCELNEFKRKSKKRFCCLRFTAVMVSNNALWQAESIMDRNNDGEQWKM